MDIQATTATPTAASGTSGAGASPAAAGQSSSTSASGNGSSFAVILGGQQSSDENGQSIVKLAPDAQTASLIGLLQMLQTLLSPFQSRLLASAGSEQQANTPPELLLQAISDPSKLSDQLLQDPNLQQWLMQTAALLPIVASAGDASFARNANLGLTAADPNVSAKLTAQQTLLQFAAALKQMPDNPIVRHLLTELQSVVGPMLANLVPANVPDFAAPSTTAADKPAVAANTANPAPRHTLAQAAASLEQILVSSVSVQSSTDVQLQQTKAKLEMLAAKSGGMVTAMQRLLGGSTADQESLDSSTQDNTSSFPLPAMHLQDLLKTLQQAQTPFRPETEATINASTFVRDMSDFMANNMKLSVGESFKQAKLSLHPENLGQIDVKITLHANGQLVAQLTADTTAGKQLLESQLPQLRQALQNQGLQVERLEVAQEQAASSSMFQQSRQQGGGQPFERESRGNESETDAVDAEFAQDLRTLAELRSGDDDSSGVSFDASV